MQYKRTLKQHMMLILLGFIYFQTSGQTELKTKVMNISTSLNTSKITADNSMKKILARGCDPIMSFEFAKVAPSLTGNAQYVPTTNDQDFVEQIKSKKWSVIYFAPGACRYSAANHQIPGGNSETEGWTIDDYKKLIYQYQGEAIQIVETPLESESIQMLNNALELAREVN